MNTMSRRLLIFITLSTIIFMIYLNSRIMLQRKVERNLVKKVNSESKHDYKTGRTGRTILIYTPLFRSIPWKDVPYDYKFMDYDGKLCPVHQCNLTYNKDDLPQSDLVVFHGRDLPSAEHLRNISSWKRPYHQAWLYFMHESPIFSYTNFDSYRGIFNWTASYRDAADLLVTYHFYRPLTVEDNRPTPGHNFAAGKKGLISYLNSHCDDARMKFIRELRKYIQVDVYGGCSRHFKPQTRPCPRNNVCKEIQKEYKFHLALENSYCADYITEKYWLNSLDMGLVPIVLGGGNYSNPKVAIPGSYINAQNFKSLKDLAEYIKYLDKNNTAYNEYHEWRYKYVLHKQNPFCLFCKAAHFYQAPRKTADLHALQGLQNCDLNLKALHKLAG